MFGCNFRGVYNTAREESPLLGLKIQLLESNKQIFTPSSSKLVNFSHPSYRDPSCAPGHSVFSGKDTFRYLVILHYHAIFLEDASLSLEGVKNGHAPLCFNGCVTVFSGCFVLSMHTLTKIWTL